MFVGLASRVLIQTVYFVIIARALDPAGYGAFLGVISLVAVCVPFASWGTGQTMIQDVARDPTLFAARWGSALVVTAGLGTVLAVVVTGVSGVILPGTIPTALVVMLALSELLFARFTDVASQAFWALGRLKRTAVISVSLSVVRLAAALLLMVLVAEPTALDWGIGYLASSVVTTAIAVGLVQRELGPPTFAVAGTLRKLREGFFFSLGQSASSTYSEIDKTMLTRLATLQAAGQYGAAYRILDVAFAPMLSLLMASYTEFFRSGAGGIRSTARFARRLLPAGCAYGALTGAALFVAAPLVPLLLGPEYRETSQAIRWLAPLPLLRAVQFLGADVLTGSGRQARRSLIYLGAAAMVVGLNLYLIPRYSWQGAAWSLVATEACLLAVVWGSVLWSCRTEASSERAALALQPKPGAVGVANVGSI